MEELTDFALQFITAQKETIFLFGRQIGAILKEKAAENTSAAFVVLKCGERSHGGAGSRRRIYPRGQLGV